MRQNTKPYMALSTLQFGERNLGRSFSKLVESIYIPYKNGLIENTGTGFKVAGQTFQDIGAAKAAIDAQNAFLGRSVITDKQGS